MDSVTQSADLSTISTTVEDWQRNGQYHDCRGHRIFYQDAGAGDILLCLHGFPTASWDWHRVWPDLIDCFRVIAPDFLGFGFSDKPRGHVYRFFEQAMLVETLLQALEVRNVHLLAHDYGVTVAQELLARHLGQHDGERLEIRSVTFLNGGLFPEATRPLPIQKILKSRLVGWLAAGLMSERTFRRSFPRIFGPNTQPTDAELHAFWSLIMHNDGARVMHLVSRYQDERRAHRERWTGALRTTEVPLRLIVGPEDPVSGLGIAARFREVVREPDVVVLDGIGHYPQVEAPERVLEALFEFVDRAA